MRVAGPVAYVDTWTEDGRLLSSEGAVLEGREYVPILAPASWGRVGQDRIVGRLDHFELWGGAVWASGELMLPWDEPRLWGASLAIDGGASQLHDDACHLTVSGWHLSEVMLMNEPNRIWPGREAVLEEE